MRSPALLPAIAFLSGAAVGGRFPELAAWPALPVSVLVWICALAALVLDARRPFLLATAAGFLLAGLLLGSQAAAAAAAPSLRQWYAGWREGHAPGDVVVVQGRLVRDATPTDFGARLLVSVEQLRDGGRERPVSGGARVTVGGRFVADRVDRWVAGRRVRLPVAFRRAPRFLNPGVADQEWILMRRGVALLGSVKSALLVDVVEAGPFRQEAAAAARAYVRRAVGAAVGPYDRRSAGIVTAILIGDRAGLDAETRQRLQAAGTFHVIAISGGNIAILTSLLLAVMRLAGVPPRAAAVGALACLLAYWQVVGSEPSVARATFVAATFLAARAADQRTSPLNTLALSAVCLVAAAPLALADTGFLLTFGATLGILVGVPRVLGGARALRFPRGRWARRALLAPAGLLAATLCAELALLPVAASAFSRVTAAGLVLNFVAIPLMTVTQVAGLLAVAAAGVSTAAAALFGQVAHLATTGIVTSAHLVDALPQLARRVPPPGPLLTLGYYGGWGLLLAAGRWPAARAAGAGLVLATGAALAVGVATGAGERACPGAAPVRALFLDVDQADATLVQFPTGESLLVDAAGVPFGTSAVGERVIAPVLWRAGVRRLDYLALTHGDPDHVGGAEAVLRDFRPREVWEGVPVPGSGRLRRLRALAVERGALWRTMQAGEVLRIGDAQVTVWHPPAPDWERQRVRNDDSLVLEIRHRDVSFVLPGDVGAEVEAGLAGRMPPAPRRVLKAPHHGSRTSSSAALLAALDPTVAIVSAGRDSRFGHPAPAVVRRYEQAGVVIYETGRAGAVEICSDGQDIRVRTAGDPGGDPPG